MIVPDRKIVEPQLRQRVPQFAQPLDLRVLARHFLKGLIGLVECPVLVGGPAHPVPAHIIGKPVLTPVRTAVDDLVNAKRRVQLGNQIESDVLPLVAEPGQQPAV
jgi:hypothetical protein